MIKIAIVDDEAEAREKIKKHLEHFAAEENGGKCGGGSAFQYSVAEFADGINFVSDYEPVYDAVFLDIKMPIMDGLTAAKHLRMKDPAVALVFVTHHVKYAINGYEYDALDFCLKPLSYETFAEKMRKILAYNHGRTKDYLVIKVEDGLINLPVSRIKYVEKDGHDLIYHTEMGVYRYRGNVVDIEEILLKYDFVRCNRGCIVNLRAVTKVDKDGMYIDNECITISRGMAKGVKSKLVSYMRGY